MLKQAFLFLSHRKTLRRWFETSRHAGRLTSRFVAGNTLDDVLRVSASLHAQGILSTVDHLGENVTNAREADESRHALEQALEAIEAAGLPSTISIKLTQLGLDLGDGVCRENVDVLMRRAKAMGSRVEIDMESSEYVTRTLALVEHFQNTYGCVRSVLQAYLFRTEEDARRMSRAGAPVRLCKGAYDEPHSIAYARKSDVDQSYLRLSRLLLDEGAYPAFATHDPRMIEGVLEHASRCGRKPGEFEFQMLYGIRRDLQEMLVKEGYLLRLYVPYGDAWYPYFMRRLAERPANVFFLARNLLRA